MTWKHGCERCGGSMMIKDPDWPVKVKLQPWIDCPDCVEEPKSLAAPRHTKYFDKHKDGIVKGTGIIEADTYRALDEVSRKFSSYTFRKKLYESTTGEGISPSEIVFTKGVQLGFTDSILEIVKSFFGSLNRPQTKTKGKPSIKRLQRLKQQRRRKKARNARS